MPLQWLLFFVFCTAYRCAFSSGLAPDSIEIHGLNISKKGPRNKFGVTVILFCKMVGKFCGVHHDYFCAVFFQELFTAEAPVYADYVEAGIHSCLHVYI